MRDAGRVCTIERTIRKWVSTQIPGLREVFDPQELLLDPLEIAGPPVESKQHP